MKSTFLSIGLAFLTVFGAEAAVTSTNLATGQQLVFPTVLGGGATLKKVVLTTDATHAGQVTLYDNNVNGYTNVVPAYTNILSYVTNYYTVWTNYYGSTNYSATNVALIDVSHSVASVTNTYNPMYVFSIPTNSTLTVDLNTYFTRGFYGTNSGTAGVYGTVGVSLTYTQ